MKIMINYENIIQLMTTVIVGLLFVLRWRPGIDLAQQDSVTLFFIRSSTVVLELHNSPEEKQG